MWPVPSRTPLSSSTLETHPLLIPLNTVTKVSERERAVYMRELYCKMVESPVYERIVL